LRNIIYKYQLIVYKSETLGTKNENSYFAIDESLFGHRDGKPIWIIDAINTQAKAFRLEGVNERNAVIIKNFINKYIETSNNIFTEGWSGYNFLNNNINYNHITHIHGGRDFGFGIQSTSHIESLWSILKSNIKSCYHVIPNKNIIKFIMEAEFKYNLRGKNNGDKIQSIFDAFKLI